ncbi:hypothetical protein AB0B66_38370 [Catellatospora sp. NPDC049111]|uniref:hypothetical protein n=1 Tax=Catellatospora sp. NPDC049111 TaxID=3155271 RepID=UPI0033D83A8B
MTDVLRWADVCLHALRPTADDVRRMADHPGRYDYVPGVLRCHLPNDHDGLHEDLAVFAEREMAQLWIRWDRRDGVREWVVAMNCPDGDDLDDICDRPEAHGGGRHARQYRPQAPWPFTDERWLCTLVPGEDISDAVEQVVWAPVS